MRVLLVSILVVSAIAAPQYSNSIPGRGFDQGSSSGGFSQGGSGGFSQGGSGGFSQGGSGGFSQGGSGGGFSQGGSGGFSQGGSGGFNQGGSGGFSQGGSGGFSQGGSVGFSQGGSGSGGFSQGGSGGGFGGSSGGYNAPSGGSDGARVDGCGAGEARRPDGSCAKAQVTRNIYLYAAPPEQEVRVNKAGPLPNPKVHYNFVFVRTPETTGGSKPIVVPPPKQKTLVYVLTKQPDALNQEVIEVPANPTQPEVYFVNYGAGDNPDLPGGIDLQQALRQSAKQPQVIDGSAGNRGSGAGAGGFGGATGTSLGGLVNSGGFGGSSSGQGNGYSAPAPSPSNAYSGPN